MSGPDWRDEWLDAELSGEAAFADPPAGAADRVLKGVLATVATGATVAGTATAGAAAGSSTGVAASGTALWIKGLVLTGLVAAGGVGISQLQSEPVQPQQTLPDRAPALTPPVVAAAKRRSIPPRPAVVASSAPMTNAPMTNAPMTDAPMTDAPITVALAAPETPQAPTVLRVKASKHPVAAPRPIARAKPPVKRAVMHAKPTKVASAPAKPRAPTAPAVQPKAPKSAATALVESDTREFNRAPTGLPRTDADLRVQRSLLTGALAALRVGQPAQAQRRLRDYRRRFGAGRLDQEHRMIAIRAHLAGGERGAALKAAQAFIQRYPKSALRATVERLVR